MGQQHNNPNKPQQKPSGGHQQPSAPSHKPNQQPGQQPNWKPSNPSKNKA